MSENELICMKAVNRYDSRCRTLCPLINIIEFISALNTTLVYSFETNKSGHH